MDNSTPAASNAQAVSREHTRSIFQWLSQVVADKNVPSSACRVAFVIVQHLNKESGEAFPSTETIGSQAALYPSSVRAMVVKLEQHGHLAVQWGRKGRGHPNRYRLIIKPQQPAVFCPKKKPQRAAISEPGKQQPDELKPQPDDFKTAAGCHEPLRNHLLNNEERGFAARSVRVKRMPVTTALTEASRERAYAALRAAYPKYRRDSSDEGCRAIFDQLLDEGVASDSLIAAAVAYAKRRPKRVRLLCFWLKVRCWKIENLHYLDAPEVAGAGGIEVLKRPPGVCVLHLVGRLSSEKEIARLDMARSEMALTEDVWPQHANDAAPFDAQPQREARPCVKSDQAIQGTGRHVERISGLRYGSGK